MRLRKGSRIGQKDPFEITAVVVRRARLGEETCEGRPINVGGRPIPAMKVSRRPVPVEIRN